MNWYDILVVVLILFLFVLAVKYIISNKNKSSCSSCPYEHSCHEKNKKAH